MPKSTLNQKTNDGLYALFKGESGMGKTVAALSFPDVYVFDFDKKMPGIAKKHYPQKDIQYDTFAGYQDVVEKVKEFYDYCPYDTLVVDSFTFLGSLIMESVAVAKGDTVPEMLQRTIDESRPGKARKGPKTIEPMSMEYYTGEVRFSEWFMDHMKTLQVRPGRPRFVITTAHVLKVESAPNIMKDGKITVTRDIVSKGRKVGQQLPAGFDDVYIFGYEQPNQLAGESKIRRFCLTENYGEDTAKCSLRGVPSYIDITDEPLYDQLFNRVIIGE